MLCAEFASEFGIKSVQATYYNYILFFDADLNINPYKYGVSTGKLFSSLALFIPLCNYTDLG